MQMKFAVFGAALTTLLGGCTIHPQPKDVTGVSTYEIVQQIRCETRQSIIDSALTYLTQSSSVDLASREIALGIAEQYKLDPSTISKLSPKLFKGTVHDILSVFWTTGVAYNYNLDMTEVNNADGTLNFGNTFSNGTFALNLKGGLDRSRQNTRTFTITDNFGDLVQKRIDCTGRIVGPNYIYPIAGRVGVDELVHAFVYLSLFGNLGAESSNPGVIPKGPPTLVDALVFTTTISGDGNPQVTFAPLGRALRVAQASLDLSASRTDKHQVVVGLALDEAAQRQLAFLRSEHQGELITSIQTAPFGRLLTASGNRAELVAASAVDQYLTQKLFSPTINVQP